MAVFTYSLRNLNAAVRRLLNEHTAIRRRAPKEGCQVLSPLRRLGPFPALCNAHIQPRLVA